MNIVFYVLSLIAIAVAAFLLYKGLNKLFKERKKELNVEENEARHVNSK